jgi:hypothetical protein
LLASMIPHNGHRAAKLYFARIVWRIDYLGRRPARTPISQFT